MMPKNTKRKDPRQLILASSSAYRKELLQRLNIDFISASPDIDETPIPGEPLADTALRLAKAKAQKMADRFPNALIIGSDQAAVFNGQLMSKPGSHPVAVKQLQQCRGRLIMVYSALCLLNSETGFRQTRNVTTQVRFRNLTDEEIENYLHAEQPYDCAGSVKTEGLGITLLSEVQSNDPTAIIGLPLIALIDMLKAENYPVL